MPGIPVKVNIAIDPTLGVLTHNLLVPPAVPVPAPTFAVEMIATQMWTLGYLTGKNKLTTTVKHRNMPIVLQDHDIGMMIPDITIPFVNAYYAIMWPFSSRKISFTSSIVKMNTKMVGCASVVPPFPMMTCGDPVTAPTAFPILNWLHTVSVGITVLDILLGVGAICFSVGLDLLFFGLSAPGTARSLMRTLAMEFLGKLVPTSPAALWKKVLSGLTGVLFHPPGQPPQYQFNIGMPGVIEGGIVSQPGQVTGTGSVFGREGRQPVVSRDRTGDYHLGSAPSS
jgi:hypothetical protein